MTLLYTGGERHIHLWQFSRGAAACPTITVLGSFDVGLMPSFLAFSRKRPLLVALSEDDNHLCSLRIEEDGSLVELSRVPCGGGPAYVSLNSQEDVVLSASYGSGETRSFPLDSQGVLHAPMSTLSTGTYSHAAVATTTGNQVFVPSKGSDSLCILALEHGKLSMQRRVTTPAGSGPRHIVFSRDGRRAYVSNENDATLLVYACEKSNAGISLSELAHLNSLPHAQQQGDTGSDVHLSQDDRFVYVSNRGHDSLSVFEVTDSGAVQIQNVSCGGQVPRNFCLLGDDLLICANQQSSSLSFFERDVQSGRLSFLGSAETQERAFWVGNRESY